MHLQPPNRRMSRIFTTTLFFAALTGFAQMPIFKRYYIADIPGLGWLADYYMTYYLHHVTAILVIAIGTYLLADHLLTQRPSRRISAFGYLRGISLLLVLITGGLLVLRNMPGYRFSPAWSAALIYSHLGLVIIFLTGSLASMLTGKCWTVSVPADGSKSRAT